MSYTLFAYIGFMVAMYFLYLICDIFATRQIGVEHSTLYRLIRLGRIPSINIGARLTRIKRSEKEQFFLNRPTGNAEKEKPLPKTFSLESEDCYTITEIYDIFPY